MVHLPHYTIYLIAIMNLDCENHIVIKVILLRHWERVK